jgi:hypothetical protein
MKRPADAVPAQKRMITYIMKLLDHGRAKFVASSINMLIRIV